MEMAELEQLHHKITQLADVHKVIASNVVVSVFHEKERKEQFTSFERFRAYNANTSSPTLSVAVKYNYSIVPADLNKPQEYVVTVRLSSRVAMLNDAEQNAPPFMRGSVLGFLTETTAEISVEYADYVIARGFMEAFDEWVQGCNAIPKNRWLHRIRQWSGYIPMLFRLGMTAAIAVFALQTIPSYFGSGSGIDLWARFLVIYLSASFVLVSLASVVGSIIEDAIDTYPALSYLKLNKGDERLIREFEQRRKRVWLSGIVAILSTIVLGVISSRIDRLL